MLNTNNNPICILFGDTDDVILTRSRLFWLLPVDVGRLKAWSYLLVFYSNHMPKTHRFSARGMGQTDTQTVRSIAQRHLYFLWPGRNKRLGLPISGTVAANVMASLGIGTG